MLQLVVTLAEWYFGFLAVAICLLVVIAALSAASWSAQLLTEKLVELTVKAILSVPVLVLTIITWAPLTMVFVLIFGALAEAWNSFIPILGLIVSVVVIAPAIALVAAQYMVKLAKARFLRLPGDRDANV